MAKKNIKKRGNVEILSYPLPIREETKKITNTLKLVKALENRYLQIFYNEDVLDQLKSSGKKAYKVLESLMPLGMRGKIPSRINRGILEISGRVLRSINERRVLYHHLLELGNIPKKWNYRKLITAKNIYAKAEYVRNLAEQTQNYIDAMGHLPENYMEMQAVPQLKKPMISYAPDDGQAIHIVEKGDYLEIELKVISEENIEGNSQDISWQWVKVKVPLPENLRKRKMCQPDLRLICIHGHFLPVLDYKIEMPCESPQYTPRLMTIDWGIRKLVTICIFDRKGNQISIPIFLHFDPIKAKLLRIRKEIDYLKAKRDRLPKNSCKRKKFNREIAKRWRKYRAIDKALAHFAANIIVLIAKLYNCSTIYIEWLKGLKSKDKSRETNWLINTTIRQKIYDLVAYKARILGMKLAKPIPPGYTSRYCPKCGKLGYHAPSSDRLNEKKPAGEWFVCPHCGYNADRDYVACQNLARKALYGNSLKNQTKAFVYKKDASGILSRQRNRLQLFYCRRLLRNFNGWLRRRKKGKHNYKDPNNNIKTTNTIRPSAFLSNKYFFATLLKL